MGKPAKKELPDTLDVSDSVLKIAVEKAKKVLGKTGVLFGGEIEERELIPTTIPQLDEVLHGGIPVGKPFLVYGKYGCGKSTMGLFLAKQFMERFPDKVVLYVDFERALDKRYLDMLGVPIDKFLLLKPTSAEETANAIIDLIESEKISFVVIDSVTAIRPQAQVEADITQQFMGLRARFMSRFTEDILSLLDNTNTTLMFITQPRANLSPYGKAENIAGGNAIQFYSDTIFKISAQTAKDKLIKDTEGIPVGFKTEVFVDKLKHGTPFKTAEFTLRFGEGYDVVASILDYAVDQDIIEKSGASYSYDEEKIGHGKEKTIKYLKEHPEVITEIMEKLDATKTEDWDSGESQCFVELSTNG